MKYIISINQLVLSKTKLDLKDCAILDYLKSFCGADDKKIRQLEITEKEITYKYTWINFRNLITEMPLLGLKGKASVSERIQKIEKEGFIKTFRAPDRSLYVRLTEKIKELDFAGQGVRDSEQGCSAVRTGGVRPAEQHKHNNYSNKERVLTSQSDGASAEASAQVLSSSSKSKKVRIPSSSGIREVKGNPEVKKLINTFREYCKNLKGFTPEISWARDSTMAKKRLQEFKFEELEDLLDWFLDTDISERLSCSLSVALSTNVINNWLRERAKNL